MTSIQPAQLAYDKLQSDQYQAIQTWRTSTFCFERNGVKCCLQQRRQNCWKMQEKIKHLAFLYYCEFPSQRTQDKVSWQIFKKMSTFIKTKNPNQCRIYHKRSINKYKTISHFLAEIKHKIAELDKILLTYKHQIFALLPQQLQQTSQQSRGSKFHRQLENSQKIKENSQKQRQQPQNREESQEEYKIQGEKQKLDFMKTNTTCKEQSQEQKSQRPEFEPLIGLEKPYPINSFSTFLLNPTNKQQSSLPLFTGFSNMSVFKPTGLAAPQTRSKEQQWQQCYQLYVAWTTKLSRLMSNYD